jgi:hypothetical protein
VDDKPVFVIFAPHDLPSTADFIDHWRELAHKSGFPGLYFVAIANRYQAGVDLYRNPMLAPFDAVTPLTPQDFLENQSGSISAKIVRRLRTRNFSHYLPGWASDRLGPARYRFAEVVAQALNDLPADPRYLPSVLAGWDNTPRSGRRGVVFEGMTPELFTRYLMKAVDHIGHQRPQNKIIFLKAWNEWAEGNTVEPDALNGHAYLHAIRDVMLPGKIEPSASSPR